MATFVGRQRQRQRDSRLCVALLTFYIPGDCGVLDSQSGH